MAQHTALASCTSATPSAHLSQLKQQIMSPLKTGSQTCPVHSCNFRQTSWLHFSVTGTTAHRRVTAWHQARRPLRLLQGSIPSRYSQLYTCTSFPERKLPPVPRSTCWHRAHCLCPHASLCLWNTPAGGGKTTPGQHLPC